MTTQDSKRPLVLMTGSSGLIGTRLVGAMHEDYRIVGLDLKEPEPSLPETGWVQADLTDDDSVASALDEVRNRYGARIASVIHLAAYYDFSGEPSPLYRDLTVEGTRRLLRHLQSFEVEQFVFSSSLLVMKSSENGAPIAASSPLEAEWDYPQSKLAAEKAIREERNAIPAVVLRIAGVYDEDCHSLPIAQQIHRIYEKQIESYFFPGDKTHGQAFVHLDDLAACFKKVVERRGRLSAYETFVIGEDDVMSYEELQDELGKKIHGKQWPTIWVPKIAAKAGAWVKGKLAHDDEDAPFIKPWMIDLSDQNYPVDIGKARDELDWNPQRTLHDTLSEIVDRLQRDPKRWHKINGIPYSSRHATQRESAGASSS